MTNFQRCQKAAPLSACHPIAADLLCGGAV